MHVWNDPKLSNGCSRDLGKWNEIEKKKGQRGLVVVVECFVPFCQKPRSTLKNASFFSSCCSSFPFFFSLYLAWLKRLGDHANHARVPLAHCLGHGAHEPDVSACFCCFCCRVFFSSSMRPRAKKKKESEKQKTKNRSSPPYTSPIPLFDISSPRATAACLYSGN